MRFGSRNSAFLFIKTTRHVPASKLNDALNKAYASPGSRWTEVEPGLAVRFFDNKGLSEEIWEVQIT